MIEEGDEVRHLATGKFRRVTGRRGDGVHFSPVIKHVEGDFYWASVEECVLVRKKADIPP